MEQPITRSKRIKQKPLNPYPNLETPETMSSWLQRQASSHQTQLAATALLSGALVAGTIYGFQSLRRSVAVEELKASIPNIDEHHHADRVH